MARIQRPTVTGPTTGPYPRGYMPFLEIIPRDEPSSAPALIPYVGDDPDDCAHRASACTQCMHDWALDHKARIVTRRVVG